MSLHHTQRIHRLVNLEILSRVLSRVLFVIGITIYFTTTATTLGLAADPPTGVTSHARQVTPVELNASLFKKATDIEAWITSKKRQDMQAHGWQMFAACMGLTDQRDPFDLSQFLRVYDTWQSIDDVLVGAEANASATAGASKAAVAKRTESFVRRLKPVTQLRVRKAADGPSASTNPPASTLVSDVRYSPSLASDIISFVIKPGEAETSPDYYVLRSRRDELRKSMKPLDKWEWNEDEDNFPNLHAVMLKPSYSIISHQGPTVLTYWSEDVKVTNPKNDTEWQPPQNAPGVANERWWEAEVVVVPELTVTSANRPKVYDRFGQILPVVSLRAFHYFKLTADQADALNETRDELHLPNKAEAGDFAVLVAMHVATHEISDWTWQTFWWSPMRINTAKQLNDWGVPDDVAEMFYEPRRGTELLAHFRLAIGYSFVEGKVGNDFVPQPNQPSIICSNPYLEGPFGPANFGGVDRFLTDEKVLPGSSHRTHLGVKSNCVSCHRAAAYPAFLGATPPQNYPQQPDPLMNYVDYGFLKGDEETLFKDRVKTNYIWSVANKVSEKDFGTAPPPKK